MNIIILGPQGSGKGTQAQILVEKHKLFYLEAGSLLREIAKDDPWVDEMVNKKGELIPDDVMFDFVKQTLLSNLDKLDNILFDGYPRSVTQFQLLEEFLASVSFRIDFVIFLNISDEESIRRLSARRIHKKTGKIYNLITNPPGPEVDLQDLIQREDDKPAAIKERLALYKQNTYPLIEFLKEKKLLVEIDGEASIESISSSIDAELSRIL